MESKDLLIGAHTSAAGGVFNALYEGKSIGATTVQLFTSNQKQWKSKPYAPEVVDQWFAALDETGLRNIMCHDSYLINLGSPKEDVLAKSLEAFREEVKRCHTLKISYLNFHPGAALTDDEETCLDRIVRSLIELEGEINQGETVMLLEATAGQGSTVGYKFEHLAYIIQGVKEIIPIGVCIDTCHIFCAGYDIRTSEAWDKTLDEFDEVVGLDYLYAFHVNDSMKPYASRKDRHADLGEGEIGMESFKALMQNRRVSHLPKYLETPGGCPTWEKEIQLLREFASGKR